MLAVPLTDYYEEVRRYLTCPEEVKDDPTTSTEK